MVEISALRPNNSKRTSRRPRTLTKPQAKKALAARRRKKMNGDWPMPGPEPGPEPVPDDPDPDPNGDLL